MSTIPLGRFVWYEVNAYDVDAARDFYVEIAGWKTEVWKPDGREPYTMFLNERGPVGGVFPMPDEPRAAGVPQHCVSYISTPDVDQAIMLARDHHARVLVPPADIPEVGRFAVLADPQGASYALLAPARPPEDTPFDPALGDISWHELATTDHKAALAYYSELYGWEKSQTHDMGETGIYQMFGRHGKDLGGMYDKPADMPAPPNWLIYIRVADVAERVARIRHRLHGISLVLCPHTKFSHRGNTPRYSHDAKIPCANKSLRDLSANR